MNSRQMEEYLSEKVPPCFYIKTYGFDPTIRDHSNISRACSALGSEDIEEVNRLIVHLH